MQCGDKGVTERIGQVASDFRRGLGTAATLSWVLGEQSRGPDGRVLRGVRGLEKPRAGLGLWGPIKELNAAAFA